MDWSSTSHEVVKHFTWWGRWSMKLPYSHPFWAIRRENKVRVFVQWLFYPSGYGARVNFCCVYLLCHSRETVSFASSLPAELQWAGGNTRLFCLCLFFFLSKALSQNLLLRITSIRAWGSVLASSILLLRNNHFSSIKIAIQLLFCLYGNFKCNNKAVGDVVSQKSVTFKWLLIATKWMPAQSHGQ